MDLNLSYFQHQIALIRAANTASAPERWRHLGDASGIARRIGNFQLTQGAAAGAAWCKTAKLPEGAGL